MAARRVSWFLFGCWIVLLKSGQPVAGFTTGNETALRTDLFTTYDITVRPFHPTLVTLTLVPTALNSIDVKAQTMSLSGWWILAWSDSRLVWDPSSYDDISETHVFQNRVWTPTVVIYNSVNDLSAIDEESIPVRILSSGQLEWSPPGILTVSCDTDVTHFPFDTQICGVSVKTFGYTVRELVLQPHPDQIDLSYYSGSGDWKLLRTWTQRTERYNHSEVTFNFEFERKPEYYGLNLILPVLVMGIMMLFTFILPSESDEKMGYSLTVMLTFVVLMTLVADMMPTTAEHISYFEVYVVLVLLMCALSVMLSIISLRVFFKEDEEPVPAKARDVTRLLMRFTCSSKSKRAKDQHQATGVSLVNMQMLSKEDGDRKPEEPPSPEAERASVSSKPEVTWKKMSMVMDSFCFWVFLVVLIVLTIVFLAIIAS